MAIMQIAVTKSKGSAVDIDTDKLPQEVYEEALRQGLKVLVNRGMSKITKAELGDEATVKAEALTKAQKNVDDIYAGKVKLSGSAKATKVSGAVNTEAMRLARNLVKDEMKKAGIKISHVEASEITKAAKEVLNGEQGPRIIEMATANIAERTLVPVKFDVKSIPISDKKVKAAEAKKAKDQLSAKQAGMTAKAKPKAQAAQTAH